MRSIPYRNPVFPGYLADPFVFKSNGVYYAIGSGGTPDRDAEPGVFDTLSSPDLVDWVLTGRALKALPSEYGDTYWAPEIVFIDGRFWMFYSVGFEDRMHHLRVAVGDRADGLYEDTGAQLTNPFYCPFAIDPSPFRDEDGSMYLFYARDFLDTEEGSRIGTGIVVDRLLSTSELAGDPRVVVRPRSAWQRYKKDRIIYGGVYDWHTTEGPCVRKRNGRYWCLYSGGCWQSGTYGLDFAVADHVLGPYTAGDDRMGPRLLRTVPRKVIGPGHASVILGPDDETEYLVYHAWDPAMNARTMRIDPIEWTNDGPRTPGPTYTLQSVRG